MSAYVSFLSLQGNSSVKRIPLIGASKGSVYTFSRKIIRATIEQLLKSFPMRSISHQRKIYGSLCNHLLLLGNNSVKKLTRQRIIVGSVAFYAVRVVSNKNRRLVLRRNTCFWRFFSNPYDMYCRMRLDDDVKGWTGFM
jgi:hypothetical protein